jgi:hypothetical protein
MNSTIETLHSILPGHLEPLGRGNEMPSTWVPYQVPTSTLFPYRRTIEAMYSAYPGYHDKDHDPKHIFRGMVLSLQLARIFQGYGQPVNEYELLWSFALHDAGSNHHDMPDHGDRGAALVAPLVRAKLSPLSAERIIANVKWHNKPPQNVPPDVFTLEHLIMRTADTLELLRLDDGREIRFLTGAALPLVSVAEDLIRKTELFSLQYPFDHVAGVAERMGLLVAK